MRNTILEMRPKGGYCRERDRGDIGDGSRCGVSQQMGLLGF